MPDGHTVMQVPQCAGLVCRLAQVPPQFVVPVGQAHWPFTQVAPEGHGCPQPPQFRMSVMVLTQLPLQSVSPGPHVTTHCPPVHVLPGGQTLPQLPQ
jgi:hypothetical protein